MPHERRRTAGDDATASLVPQEIRDQVGGGRTSRQHHRHRPEPEESSESPPPRHKHHRHHRRREETPSEEEDEEEEEDETEGSVPEDSDPFDASEDGHDEYSEAKYQEDMQFIRMCAFRVQRGERTGDFYGVTYMSLANPDMYKLPRNQVRHIAEMCRTAETLQNAHETGQAMGALVIGIMENGGNAAAWGCDAMRRKGKNAPALYGDTGARLRTSLESNAGTVAAARKVGMRLLGGMEERPVATLALAMVAGLMMIHQDNVSSGVHPDNQAPPVPNHPSMFPTVAPTTGYTGEVPEVEFD
jgi:hypothetical protein